MKMVFLSYSGGLEEVVMEALTDLGIEYYTKWRGVLGRGKTSGPHLGEFNRQISLPELVDSTAAMSAMCIAGRFMAGYNARVP